MCRFFFVSVLLIAQFASAETLQQATNTELLRELDRRLSGNTGGGAPTLNATFTCDSDYNLNVVLVNMNTGDSGNYAAFSRDCPQYASFFSSKLGKGFSSGKLIAWCDRDYHLIQVWLPLNSALKEVSKKSSPNCTKDAQEINDRL